VLTAGLCGGMGWIGERAWRPIGATRWAAQSLAIMGAITGGVLVSVDAWVQGLVIETEGSTSIATLIVTVCLAAIGALVGLIPAQWLSLRSAALQSLAGLTAGAIAGIVLTRITPARAFPGNEGNFVQWPGGAGAVVGGGTAGALIGAALGLGHVLACRRCVIPQSGWRSGRWIPVGHRGGVIGSAAGTLVHVVGPDVQDVHARIDRVSSQHHTDQLIPIGPVWLDGQQLTQQLVLPFGETTLHLGRPDGPAVVYRKA